MSKKLVEKKNDLLTRADAILELAKKETRELTDDELKELEQIKADIERIKATLKLDDEFRGLDDMEKKEDEEPKDEEEKEDNERSIDGVAVKNAEYRAFDAYIRGAVLNTRDDTGAMKKGDNGAVIPTSIAKWIVKKVYDICPVLEKSTKYNVKGTLQIPYYPADANNISVAYQDEFSALTSSSGKFASITLSGYLAGALTKISRSLINNAEIDIVAFVVDEMSYAIKRFIEHELLVGTAGKVEGLSGLTNSVTTASASAITADEVVKVHDAIKDEYQGSAIWIMSSATRTALRLLKSQTGYYLLNDDISSPFGTTLLGKPVYVSDSMPEIGSGNTCIYYGDMKGLVTKFSEDINIQVLREKYADEHADGVIGWFEFDSKVADEQQLAKLVCNA